MPQIPLLIKGGRIIDPSQGHDKVGDLLLQDGKVAAVMSGQGASSAPEGCRMLEARGLVVCPGFIDLHCHLREPGYEDKETIATGTRAAARGGFTTLCAMPNTSPPADSRATVEFVLRKGREEGSVRVLPIGCVTQGRQGRELAEMGELAEAGVVGFSDDGAPVYDASIMRQALTYSRGLGLPIINHCEDPTLAAGGVVNEGWVSTRLGLKGVPQEAEEVMVSRDIALAQLTGGQLHLAHLSTADALAIVRRAKERGLQVTCEVTPHHLTLTEEWVVGRKDGDLSFGPLNTQAYDTRAKVNPPLRRREDLAALVEGLRDGVIDAIATDHAPHTQVDKVCTFDEAAFGISVLETALGSLLSLVHRGRVDLVTIVDRLTLGPARLLGSNLGTLKPGAPADVTIFDPDAQWTVDTSRFASKGKNTPLEGVSLKGVVVATIVGGRMAYAADRIKPEVARA